MKTRVIGLGNPILRDDGVGIYVAREVARKAPWVDVIESETAGFGLMEQMVGWERVILVDAIQFEKLPAGKVLKLDPMALKTSVRLRSVHEIDLPTVLKLGQMLGLEMPREVIVLGIQVEDTRTFGEGLSKAATRGLHEAVKRVLEIVGDAHARDGDCD